MDQPLLDFTATSHSESPIICPWVLDSQHCPTVELPSTRAHTNVNQNLSQALLFLCGVH